MRFVLFVAGCNMKINKLIYGQYTSYFEFLVPKPLIFNNKRNCGIQFTETTESCIIRRHSSLSVTSMQTRPITYRSHVRFPPGFFIGFFMHTFHLEINPTDSSYYYYQKSQMVTGSNWAFRKNIHAKLRNHVASRFSSFFSPSALTLRRTKSIEGTQ